MASDGLEIERKGAWGEVVSMPRNRWSICLGTGGQHGSEYTIEDARTEIFEFIEMYYNTIRIHSSLSYQSPMEYEEEYHRNASKKAVTLKTK
jgi:transposase InsO family protein